MLIQDQREGTDSESSGPQHNQGQELSCGFIANIADTPGFEYQDGLCFIWLPKIQYSFLNTARSLETHDIIQVDTYSVNRFRFNLGTYGTP